MVCSLLSTRDAGPFRALTKAGLGVEANSPTALECLDHRRRGNSRIWETLWHTSMEKSFPPFGENFLATAIPV